MEHFTIILNLVFSNLNPIEDVCVKAGKEFEAEAWDSAIARYYLAEVLLKKELAEMKGANINDIRLYYLICINIGLGLCYKKEHQYDVALKYFKKVRNYYLQLEEKVEDSKTMELYWWMGKCHYKKGRLENAVRKFEKVWTMFKSIEKSPIDEDDILHYLGLSYTKMGDYANGLRLLKKAKKLRKKEDKKNMTDDEKKKLAKTNMGIALCHSEDTSSNKSRKCLKKAHKVFKKMGEKRELIKSCIYSGDYFRERNKLKKALKHYYKGLDKLTEYEKDDVMLETLLHRGVGKCFLRQGEYGEAEKKLQKALKLGKEILEEYSTKLAILHSDLADCYAHQKKYIKALRCCQVALIKLLPDYEEGNIYNNPETKKSDHLKQYLLEILNNKAYAFYSLYQKSKQLEDLKMAYATFELVDKLVHGIREDYQMEKSKMFLASRSHKIYDAAVEVAYELSKLPSTTDKNKYLQKCFEWAEMGQSYVLMSDIKDKDAKKEAGIPIELLEEEKRLRLELARLDKSINWTNTQLKSKKWRGKNQKIKKSNLKIRFKKKKRNMIATMINMKNLYRNLKTIIQTIIALNTM